MSESNKLFCNDCKRDVGTVVKRGPWGMHLALAILSFVGLFIYQFATMPTPAQRFMSSKYGMQIEQGVNLDWFLIIPLFFLILAIVGFNKKTFLCPICKVELSK